MKNMNVNMSSVNNITSINPIDIADYDRSNQNMPASSNMSSIKPTCLNFNLSISNNNIEDGLKNNLIKRNLYETGMKWESQANSEAHEQCNV